MVGLPRKSARLLPLGGVLGVVSALLDLLPAPADLRLRCTSTREAELMPRLTWCNGLWQEVCSGAVH